MGGRGGTSHDIVGSASLDRHTVEEPSSAADLGPKGPPATIQADERPPAAYQRTALATVLPVTPISTAIASCE